MEYENKTKRNKKKTVKQYGKQVETITSKKKSKVTATKIIVLFSLEALHRFFRKIKKALKGYFFFLMKEMRHY